MGVEETPMTELPTETARKCLQEVIKNQFHLKDAKIEISDGSSKGDNYLGIIYRIRICDTNDNSEKYVIAKLPPTNEARRAQFQVRSAFVREVSLYDEFVPLVMQFQRDKGIDILREGFYEVPKCFLTSLKEPEEVLIFEDLRASGFQMFDRQQELTLEHVEPVMKVLGKYHALSLALKQQKPYKIAKFMQMDDIFLSGWDNEQMQQYFDTLKQKALATLDEDKDADILPRIREFFSKSFIEMLKMCVDKDGAEPYAVVCHGDCWNNNIMYKYENGKFQREIRLLDWQIMRYGSPVLDLVYYLFGSATQNIRDHMPHLLRTYYKSLSIMLIRLDCSPELTFPFSALERQLKRFGKFGLFMAILCLPVFTSNAEDIPDLDDVAEKFEKGETIDQELFSSDSTVDVYKQRMRDVLRDTCHLGYL